MFVKNWYKALSYYLCAKTAANITSQKFKACTGGEYTFKSDSYYHAPAFGGKNTSGGAANMASYISKYTGGSSGGVVFGSGTTPPTLDDYCLSGTLLSGLTVSAAVTPTWDADGCTVTGVYTITNSSGVPVTISEVGLVGATINNVTYYAVLLERTLLENPISLDVNEIGQVTYSIRFNYPTS